MFGADVDAFKQVAEIGGQAMESAAACAAQLEWRKRGPVGKLHNLVVYIRSSTPRREAWRRKRVDNADIDGKSACCGGGKVEVDVDVDVSAKTLG